MAWFKRAKASENAGGVLLVTDGGVRRVATGAYGMDLVQEIARLLGSEHIRSTRLGEDLSLWHAEESPGRPRAGAPNTVASRFAAEHGVPPVIGPAVLAGPVLYGSPYPLDVDEVAQVAARLGG